MDINPREDRSLGLARQYLPDFQFSETHEIDGVEATAEAILDAGRTFDDSQDPVLNGLLVIREYPARLATRLGLTNGLSRRPRFGLANFLLLERTGTEIAFGLIGRFWRPDFGLISVKDGIEFRDFNLPGVAKLVMCYSVLETGGSGKRLLTETRIYCPDRRTKLLFLPYWLAIRIASGWIRRRILNQIKREAEKVSAGSTS